KFEACALEDDYRLFLGLGLFVQEPAERHGVFASLEFSDPVEVITPEPSPEPEPEPEPEPAPAPTPTPDGIELLNAPKVYDGRTATVVEHEEAFEVSSGLITIDFNASSTNNVQTLFSKDSNGKDDGGHLTLSLDNGQLSLRAQTVSESLEATGGTVRAGQDNTVTIAWEDGDLALGLNGQVVDTVSGWTGLGPNLEPIVIGASQARSGDGVADNLESYFTGEISSVTFDGEPTTPPTDGGGTGGGKTGDGTTDDDVTPPVDGKDLGLTSAEMFAPFAEWTLSNDSISGNAYDLDGTAVFTHVASGEVHEVGMFYNGDGSYSFRFSGTEAGEWTFETRSSDADLNGYSGKVQVAADPDARGFVVASGDKFAQQLGDGSLDAILPNYAMMSNNIEDYLDNPAAIDDFIQTFMVEHGFTGVHIPNIGAQLFDIDSNSAYNGSRFDGSQGWNPDPDAFRAIEQIITAVHEAGGVVHIWPWGDSARGQTPDQMPGGENGEVHQRIMEYMVDRLRSE
ncbi:MAG: DUF5060 domain-containing protein, partial [Pseudomonadota bacterium]